MANQPYVHINARPEDHAVLKEWVHSKGMSLAGLLRILADRVRNGQEV